MHFPGLKQSSIFSCSLPVMVFMVVSHFFLVFKFKRAIIYDHCVLKVYFHILSFLPAQVFMITIYIVYDNKRSFYSLKKTFISQLVSFSQQVLGITMMPVHCVKVDQCKVICHFFTPQCGKICSNVSKCLRKSLVKSVETVTLSFCQILKKNIFHFVHFYIDLALRCYCYCGTYSTIFMVLKHE